jgi:hypothetical protein
MRSQTLCARIGLVVLSICSAACFGPHRRWTDNLVWSPDGTRAAVLASDLYLSDRAGSLTPLHAPDVYRIAWAGDSQHLVLARSRTVSTFAEVAAAVGPERTRVIAADAERLWLLMHAADWEDYLASAPSALIPDVVAVAVYLREHYADALRSGFPDVWKEFQQDAPRLHSVVSGHVADGRLESDTILYEGLTPVKTIRPASGTNMVAFVTKDEEFTADDTVRTYVVPADGSAPATLIDERTGEFPDWTPDGRSLVYFESWSADDPNNGARGCLAIRQIVGADGQPRLDERRSCLAYVIFEKDAAVRCLRDGRVLFEALEMQFPSAAQKRMTVLRDGEPLEMFVETGGAGDGPQVFAVDTAHPVDLSKVIASPQLDGERLGFYEVSPDFTRLLFGAANGDVRLMTLSDGRTERLPLGLLRKDTPYSTGDLPTAAWSGPDAVTYVKRVGSRNEYILRRGDTEVVLSRDWPAEMLWPIAHGG